MADCLSRIPLKLSPEQESAVFNAVEDNARDPVEDLPVSAADVAMVSKQDPDVNHVIDYIAHGWPSLLNESLKPYYRCRNELTIEADCLVRGHRTVIPDVLRRPLLEELHSVHIGMSRMKSVARSFFWWPSLDRDIENLASHCTQCQELSRRPVTDVPHHWVYPTEAFERVHLDYAEFEGSHYLLLVDSYSKWVDVFTMNIDCSTTRTADCLLAFIAAHGIPKTLVSDNGPQFTSHAFKKFCLQNVYSSVVFDEIFEDPSIVVEDIPLLHLVLIDVSSVCLC